jgi:hypothetical protein
MVQHLPCLAFAKKAEYNRSKVNTGLQNSAHAAGCRLQLRAVRRAGVRFRVQLVVA